MSDGARAERAEAAHVSAIVEAIAEVERLRAERDDAIEALRKATT